VPEADARPDGFGRVGEADGCGGRVAVALLLAFLVLAGAVFDGRAEAGGLDRGAVGNTLEAVVAGRADRSAGDGAGLNVATDSIAPATRHTARMLASSGMTVPCPPKGPVSRRSRLRRRFARISRW
jgi:hypothetical protein